MQDDANDAQELSKQVELVYQEGTASAFVYSINDWETLRKKYKITGEIFGHTQFTPALPLRLNPEEVVLLVSRGIAKLVTCMKLRSAPTEQDREKIENFRKELFNEEKIVYTKLRKEEVSSSLEKIIAGKRKHGDERSEDEILQEELDKSSTITEDAMIWPTLTQAFEEMKGENTDVPQEIISRYTTKVKCLVYEDLWKKGFYITSGQKFGADFLVYLGDPILFHADYMVRCVENCDKTFHTSELIAFGRLGTSVKKKAVLASLNEDCSVGYLTLNWVD